MATDILTISSKINHKEDETFAHDATESLRAVAFDPDSSSQETNSVVHSISDHDYGQVLQFEVLSPFVENFVVYIAGFVVRKLLVKVSCAECKSALVLLSGLSLNEDIPDMC
jgi:hypothetical protein